jgi:hypothetical protein
MMLSLFYNRKLFRNACSDGLGARKIYKYKNLTSKKVIFKTMPCILIFSYFAIGIMQSFFAFSEPAGYED